MERRCIMCGCRDRLVDVYKVADIKNFAAGNNIKAELSKPITYCMTHFMIEKWNKQGYQLERGNNNGE